MSTKSIILTSSGLKNILSNEIIDSEFVFTIGGKEFKMNNLFAEFISPIVSKLHHSDPTQNFYIFDHFYIKDNNNFQQNMEDIMTVDTISLIKQLSQGYSITINSDQAFKLRILSVILGNDELYQKINENFPTVFEESNIDLYLHNLKSYYNFSEMLKEYQFSDIIDFLSEHFYSLDQSELLTLPRFLLYSIISSDRLKIENEDSLLDFINRIFDRKSDTFELEDIKIADFYEKVEFNDLTEYKFKEFLNEFDISEMTNGLWRKLNRCFFRSTSNEGTNHRHFTSNKVFQYDGDIKNCFRGIIHFLSEKCHGNVDEKGVVKVTSSSVYNDRYPKYVVDLDDEHHYFTSDCRQNSWIKLDFLARKVRPTGYALRTKGDSGKGGNHMKSWVVEASNTDWGDEWKVFDERYDVDELDEANAKCVFDVKEELGVDEFYRYVRIRQIKKNSFGSYFLNLSAFEIFGELQ